MDDYYLYEDGIAISNVKINRISDAFADSIKKELPEEAQCIDVIESILDEIKNVIRKKKIIL